MAVTPFEFLVNSGRFENVVKRDADGNPSVFVRFPKMLMSELDDRLPEAVHPAFIGPEGEERDSILLAKYKSAQLKAGDGRLFSLPNLPPKNDYASHYQAIQWARGFGGTCCMSVWDYGFLTLLADREGWTPQGNDRTGVSANSGITAWRSTLTYGKNAVRAYNGWTFKSLQSQDGSRIPDRSPAAWQRLEKIGGTVVDPAGTPGVLTKATLTGSGPAAWYLGGDLSGLADIVGDGSEFMTGFGLDGRDGQILLKAPERAYVTGDGDYDALDTVIYACRTAYGEGTYGAKGENGRCGLYIGNHYDTDEHLSVMAVPVEQTMPHSVGIYDTWADMITSLPTGWYLPWQVYAAGIVPLPEEGAHGATGQEGRWSALSDNRNNVRRRLDGEWNKTRNAWVRPLDVVDQAMRCAGGGNAGAGCAGLGYRQFEYGDRSIVGMTVRMKYIGEE